MKKRKIKKFLLINIVAVCFVLFAGYFLLAFYYRQGFAVNTWINGVYCTGRSVEEVNSELLSQVEAPIVIITDRDGNVYEISLTDADYQEDYLTTLHRFMRDQNPYLWIGNVMFHRNHVVFPLISYDKDKVKQLFNALEPIRQEQQKQTDYTIEWTAQNGYQLYDGLSDRLDTEKVYQLLISTIELGEHSVDMRVLEEATYYYDVPLTAEQKELKMLWKKIDAFQNCGLVYDMGAEKIVFTPEIMSGFLEKDSESGLPILDENGELVLSEAAVEEYVANLANSYDTYGLDRTFNSTRGEMITLTKGTYGTTINQKSEVKYLMENLFSTELHFGVTVEHIPEYKREAFVRGLDDIGGTYIEIDMTAQKLYYYVDREIVVETDVVTGNMRRKMGTPSGVYYVYNKQTDRILRGPGYASPVDYWMPVKGGIGIHDANWRKEFGGEIYKKNGSHGCINVPPEVMPELYEMVEIGTPVIMFY